MSEGEPNSFESEPEHIPTLEEVRSVIELFINGGYREIRKIEDERGLYLYEVMVSGDNPDEEIEYAYRRKRPPGENPISTTEIHAIFHVKGEAISGTSAARYVDGKWKIL